jgi:hypothetical protein
MPEASRHAKPKPAARRVRVASIVAAAALAGVAAATLMLTAGSAGTTPVRYVIPAARTTGAVSTANDDTGQTVLAFRHRMAVPSRRAVIRAAVPRRHTASAVAPPAPQPTQQTSPRPAPTASAPPVASGGDAAHSALGICVRNAEEGGSYAWGPGNGGGAYQFLLGTWEKYGGAASEYGVAGPAYQDRIFDNAVAAGGASNWTAYDGC